MELLHCERNTDTKYRCVWVVSSLNHLVSQMYKRGFTEWYWHLLQFVMMFLFLLHEHTPDLKLLSLRAAVMKWTGEEFNLRDMQVAVRWSGWACSPWNCMWGGSRTSSGCSDHSGQPKVEPHWGKLFTSKHFSAHTEEFHNSGHLLHNKLVHEHHKHSDLQIMQSWKTTLKNIVHKNPVSKKDVKMSFNLFMESTLLVPHDRQFALNCQQLQIKSKLLY